MTRANIEIERMGTEFVVRVNGKQIDTYQTAFLARRVVEAIYRSFEAAGFRYKEDSEEKRS